jgi:uncharacterized protein (TIGR02246 family)
MFRRHSTLAVFLVTLALAGGFPSVGPAAEGGAAGESESAKAVRQIEEELDAAINRLDPAPFEKHLAEDYTIVQPDGTVQTKADSIATMKSGDVKVELWKARDRKVRVYGDSAAVATFVATEKSSYKGKKTDEESRWTDVFVKRDGRWVCVAMQGTTLAPEEKAKGKAAEKK